MNRLNKIERLKDALHDSDYKAIKHSEGWIADEEYADTRAERQAIRDEINQIENMTDAEYWEAFPDEVEPPFEGEAEDFNEIPDNDYDAEATEGLDGSSTD